MERKRKYDYRFLRRSCITKTNSGQARKEIQTRNCISILRCDNQVGSEERSNKDCLDNMKCIHAATVIEGIQGSCAMTEKAYML